MPRTRDLPGGFPRPKPPYTLTTWAAKLESMIAAGQVSSPCIAGMYRRWALACRIELARRRIEIRRWRRLRRERESSGAGEQAS